MNQQDITIQTYQNNFNLYKEKTPSVVSGEFVAWIDAFINLLPQNGNVFELGSAEGRDARYLRDKGFSVFCTDVIPQAFESLVADGFTTYMYDLRAEPQQKWVNSFEGVFAKAVYLHIPQDIFEKSLDQMSTLLKDGGIFCCTFKLGVGEEVETGELGGERYFKYYTEEELQNIFQKHRQYEVIKTMVTNDEKWVQFLLKKKEW